MQWYEDHPGIELSTNLREFSQCPEKAPTWALSLYKEEPISAHNILRHYAEHEVGTVFQKDPNSLAVWCLNRFLIGERASSLRRFIDSSIQGYAVEIFADTFSHGGQGLRTGVQVDTVAYWSAVVMALVRLGTLTAH